MEQRALELKITADAKGLKVLQREADRTEKEFNDLGRTGRRNLDSLGRSAGSLRSTFLKLGAVIGGVFAGITIKRGIEAIVRATSAQEIAFNQLAKTIENTGVAYDTVSDKTEQFLSALQAVTTFGDEELAPVLSQIVGFVGDYEQSLESLETVLDASIGLQQDVGSTARLLGQAVAGNISALTRYVPELKGVNNELFAQLDVSERTAIVTGVLAEKYGGLARNETKTLAGQLKQLQNDFGDFLEVVGEFLIRSDSLRAVFKILRDLVQGWSQDLKEAEGSTDDLTESSDALEGTLRTVIEAVGFLVDAFRIMKPVGELAFIAVRASVATAVTAVGALAQGIGKLLSLVGVDSGPVIEEFGRNLRGSIGDTLDDLGRVGELTGEVAGALNDFGSTAERASQKLDDTIAEVRNYEEEAGKASDTTFDWRSKIEELKGSTEDSTKATKAKATAVDKLNDSLVKQIQTLKENIILVGLEGDALFEAEAGILAQKGARDDLIASVTRLKRELSNRQSEEALRLEIEALKEETLALILNQEQLAKLTIERQRAKLSLDGLTESEREYLDELERQTEVYFATERAVDARNKALEEEKKLLEDQVQAVQDLINDFNADFFSSIRDGFTDTIFGAITGELGNLGDIWDATLDTLLKSFIEFVVQMGIQTVILNNTLGSVGGGTIAGGIVSPVGGGGLGGLLSGIGSIFGFGGGGGGGLPGEATLTGANAGGLISSISSVLTPVAIIGSIVASIVPIISNLFKKKPRLDIELFELGNLNEVAEATAVTVADLVQVATDEGFAEGAIAIKGKGGKGAFSGKEADAFRKAYREALNVGIGNIQAIVNKLPVELAEKLNNEFLNSAIGFSEAGDRLIFEFDKSAKKAEQVLEEFEAFVGGGIQADLVAGLDTFFITLLESIGVSSGNATRFINDRIAEISGEGDLETRGQLGEKFLQDIETFVDAFNILEGNLTGTLTTTINELLATSRQLGFEGIPTVQEFNRELRKALNNAEVDPQTIQSFIDLRNALIAVQLEAVGSVNSLITFIQGINSTTSQFGGAVVDVTGAIETATASLLNLLEQDLTAPEREAVLQQLSGFAGQLLAEEQRIFNQRIEQQRRFLEVQISGLEARRSREVELTQITLDRLTLELDGARALEGVYASITATLDSIILGSSSALTNTEKITLLQGRLQEQQRALDVATDPQEIARISSSLEQTFSELFGVAGEAFGGNSPEFIAIFEQVTSGLEDLADLTENTGRSSDEILADIEAVENASEARLRAIDNQISFLNNTAQSLNNTTFQMSSQLQSLFNTIQNEAVTLLDFQLSELERIDGIGEQQLSVLVEIASNTAGLAISNGGGGRIPSFHTGGVMPRDGLANLRAGEIIIPPEDIARLRGGSSSIALDVNINVEGGVTADNARVIGESAGAVTVQMFKPGTPVMKQIARSLRGEI